FSEPQKMLKEVYRILKPKGKLFLYEIIGTPKYKTHKHCKKHLYSKEELIQLTSTTNFKLNRIEKGEDEICDGCSSLLELEK
ncbi:MAG: hypothetical protein RI955_1728, partial [Bacteroidota bacterium]